MEKFSNLTSAAIPLPADNIDTDQIMPKQFLRGIDRSGLARGCFANMRFLPDGSESPDCVFNRPEYRGASIIAAGPNFGCGSSREHAVWGLQQIGIRAVIAPSFGEIFYSNCFNNGLLAAKVGEMASEEIQELLEAAPQEVEIDLPSQTIAIGGKSYPFQVSGRHKTMLVEGLDPIDTTLKDIEEIREWKTAHEKAFPWMARLAGKAKRALKDREE